MNHPAQTPALPKRLAAYFQDYALEHSNRKNQLCHMIAVPLLTMSLLGLCAGLMVGGIDDNFFRWDGGTILLIASGLWYLVLDWKIAIPFSLVLIGLYFLGRATPVSGLWGIQILGWTIQLIGHYHYEKKSPAFLKNFRHFLVGPLWVFSKLIGYAR